MMPLKSIDLLPRHQGMHTYIASCIPAHKPRELVVWIHAQHLIRTLLQETTNHAHSPPSVHADDLNFLLAGDDELAILRIEGHRDWRH